MASNAKALADIAAAIDSSLRKQGLKKGTPAYDKAFSRATIKLRSVSKSLGETGLNRYPAVSKAARSARDSISGSKPTSKPSVRDSVQPRAATRPASVRDAIQGKARTTSTTRPKPVVRDSIKKSPAKTATKKVTPKGGVRFNINDGPIYNKWGSRGTRSNYWSS